MSTWRLYSLANIKATRASGREAYKINYTINGVTNNYIVEFSHLTPDL